MLAPSMKLDLRQNVRLVVSLQRFIVSARRYFYSSGCFTSSTLRIASSTLGFKKSTHRHLVRSIRRFTIRRFTSSTNHWLPRFVVVCRYAVSSYRYGISSFSVLRFTVSTRPLREAINRLTLTLHEVLLDAMRLYMKNI